MRRRNKIIIGLIIVALVTAWVYKGIANLLVENEIQELIAYNKYEECLKYLDKLIKKDPGNYKYYKNKGFILIDENKNKEGLKALKTAERLKPNDDDVLNNISWAYNNLGMYKEALLYSEKALKVEPEDPTTLTNKGNALRGLGRNAEAIKTYERSLSYDRNSAYALYGIGMISYDTDDYKRAIKSFKNYSDLVAEDYEGFLYLGQSYYYNGEYDNAITALESSIALKSDEVDAYLYKGFSYNELEKYDKAIAEYKKILKFDSKNSSAYFQIGVSLSYSEKYSLSNNNFRKASNLDKKDPYTYFWMAKNYLSMKKQKSAIRECNIGLKLDSDNDFGLKTKADIYIEQGEYRKALSIVDKGIKRNPEYVDYYTMKTYILLKQKKYGTCIAFIKAQKPELRNNPDVVWNEADCYSNLGKHAIALGLYKKALGTYSKSYTLLSNIGWEYYFLHNLDEAAKYAQKSVGINKDNFDAKDLLDRVKYDRLPESEKIADFVKNNYLYYKTIKDSKGKERKFKSKKKITDRDIYEFLQGIISDKDNFCYFIYGKAYERYIKSETDVKIKTKRLDPKTYYLSFGNFTYNTGEGVKKYLRGIKAPWEKNIVIDLRENPGGLIEVANEIADLLLPKCTTSYLVYNDGQRTNYYSDDKQIRFKKIIVLVNENTASSAELITLSLKLHLNNVTVLGHKTFGKGVGQLPYENSDKKHIILLTNFYWYVEGVNVLKDKITPDITVNGGNEKDYTNALEGVL